MAQNRALWLESFSAPPLVVDRPLPTAGSGSAVVEILATSIVPYTAAVHSGQIPLLNLQLPLVPNPNAIGRIHSVGSDAVRLKPGDLVYLDATVSGRDDANAKIMMGHHGGEGADALKLMQGDWRDGSLQQFQKAPLENLYLLDEARLCNELGYDAAQLSALAMYSVSAGAIIEAANVRVAETVVIGPSGGSFGGSAVEVALAAGANVIALGRSEDKLLAMQGDLGRPARLRYVVMSGDRARDTAAIIAQTPEGRGADVYNDWTPGGMQEPPYMDAAVRALKTGGRVVLSGGAAGSASIPYALMVHKGLHAMGQWMCSRSTLERLIVMVTQDMLSIGRASGAQVATFTLDEHEAAVKHAGKHGGWRNYTVITPQSV